MVASFSHFHIDKTFEMTSDGPTKAGKRVSSNIASARNQQYIKDSVFWLAQIRWPIVPYDVT